jgi:hypothetical protein
MSIQRVIRGGLRSNFVLGALLAPVAGCSGSNQASSDSLLTDGGGAGDDGSNPVILPVDPPDGSGSGGSCSASDLACDGGCVASDSLNCGSCGNVCPSTGNGTPSCVAFDAGYACSVSCATGYTMCAGACVATASLQTDPNNCGSCGFGCMEGACVSGSCQPWVVATGLGPPINLATDGVHVAYYNGTAGFEAPLVGGTAISLTPNFGNCQTVGMGGGKIVFGQIQTGQTSSSVWIATDGQASSGTNVSLGSSAAPTAMAVSQDGSKAYVNLSSPMGGGVYACSLGAGPSCVPLFTPPDGSTGLVNEVVTVSDYLFVTDVANGRLWRYLLPSGPASIIATDPGLTRYLAIDSTYVYWASFSAGVWTIDRLSQLDQGSPEAVATISSVHMSGLAADGTNVYITGDVESDGPGTGIVAYAPIAVDSSDAGGAPAAFVPIFQGDLFAEIAVGDGTVVWGDVTTGKIYAVRAP